MSLLDDYKQQMAQLRSDAENVTQTKLVDGLLDALTNSAQYRVYDAYSPDVYIRRGSFLDKSLYGVKRNGLSIEIEALQSGNAAYEVHTTGHIVDIVEQGGPWQWTKKNGELPGPRPFMEEGLKDYVDGGFADADLAEGLRARGYTVIG